MDKLCRDGAIVVQRDANSGKFKGFWLGMDRDKKKIVADPYVIANDPQLR
jgi:hypothetical protein